MDGIDVALIETDGDRVKVRLGPNGCAEPLGPVRTYPYDEADRALLRRAMRDAEMLVDGAMRAERPGCLADAEALVTRRHAEAVEAFVAGPLAAEGLTRADIDVLGFHGQTVLHRPGSGLTVQLGDGPALARRLGLPVVYDLRADDVAAGGQGAPLVPVFHRALARSCGRERPLAVLNIGGVANVTFIGADGALVGFDTGPGNALIDDLMAEREGKTCDENGATAAAGTADSRLLAWLLAHPYLADAPPKSLDRHALSHKLVGALSTADAAATLTALTVGAIVRALAHAPAVPHQWIVGGGGARNGEIMRQLRRDLSAEVVTADDIGWSGDGLEAQAFAFLAVSHLEGRPITFPGTTGVPEALTGGKLARP